MSQIVLIMRITLADLRIVFEIIFHDTCTERKCGVNAEYAEFYDLSALIRARQCPILK